MLFAAPVAGLELRRAGDGSATLVGRFPYGVAAELAPGRREVFGPRALEARDDVHLLSQHEFAKPLASTRAGTLRLENGADALAFEARLSARVLETQAARDALALLEEGLAAGVSPGFVVPKGGETVEARDGFLLRTIARAALVELSIVTRPAYPAAQVEARSWAALAPVAGAVSARRRWRA
jgi:HK97 family phage prohead protease